MADISKEDLRKEITGKQQYFTNSNVRTRENRKTNFAIFFAVIFPSGFLAVYSQNRAFYSCAMPIRTRIQTMAIGRSYSGHAFTT